MTSTELQTQQKKKRKRGGHNSACWICQRDHRACDSGRPCKRCISIGTSEECCNPPPKKETRPKRRKFFMVTTDSFVPSSQPKMPSPPQAQSYQPSLPTPSSRPHDSPFEPEASRNSSQFSGWQWQQAPSAIPQEPAVLAPKPSRSKPRKNSAPSEPKSQPKPSPSPPSDTYSPSFSPSTSSPTNIFATNESDDTKDQLLFSLLEEVKKLNETTGRLKNEQLVLGQQLFALQRKRKVSLDDFDEKGEQQFQISTESVISYPASFAQEFKKEQEDREEIPTNTARSASSARTPSYTSLLFPQHEIFGSRLEFDLMEDVKYLTHNNQFGTFEEPPVIPKDYLKFTESIFVPFVVDDATKPFMVMKPTIHDAEGFKKLVQRLVALTASGPGVLDHMEFHRVFKPTMLASNPAFCTLMQYDEEELLGEGIQKIFPPVKRFPPEEHQMLDLFFPPAGKMVSPIITMARKWRSKDGLLIEGLVQLQLFYENGFVSFGVGTIVYHKKREDILFDEVDWRDCEGPHSLSVARMTAEMMEEAKRRNGGGGEEVKATDRGEEKLAQSPLPSSPFWAASLSPPSSPFYDSYAAYPASPSPMYGNFVEEVHHDWSL